MNKTAVLSTAAIILALVAILSIWAAVERLAAVETGIAKLQTALQEVDTKVGTLQRQVENLTQIRQQLENVSRWAKAALSPSGDVAVRHASLFSIRYDGSYYLLTDAMGRKILLTPRGAHPEVYVEKYKPDLVVEYPVERAVFMSSTHVGLLYRLYIETKDVRLLKSVKGIMWGKEYEWYLEEVRDMLNNGTIVDVGPAYSPDVEKVAALRPEVVFVYFYPGPYGTESVIEKLKQLKIPYVVINEFQEATPLGRFEWIKFIATFYNKTAEAARLFSQVEARWNSLAALVADLERPRVAWFIIYGGVVYPAGVGARELIRLAGGRYAYANYSRVDMEVILKHRDVDILVWSGYGVQTVGDLVKIDKRLAELRPVVTGRVFAYSKAFWQLSHVYPERLLEELIWIIHPEVMPPGDFKLFVPLE
ncbi:MAG: ABC transporter substrate-binding protein [Pyrobaculum sp.]